MLGKCQLQEVVQEKEKGLDSVVKYSDLNEIFRILCCELILTINWFYSCGRWLKLEHGAKTAILFGAGAFEEKPDTRARRSNCID